MNRNNNFDFIRFFAAAMVIVTHAFILSEGDSGHEWIFRISRGQLTFSNFAVKAFFVISGFLITGSFEKSRDLPTFFKARFLRIIPGFFLALLFGIVVGAAMTSLSFRDYILHSDTLLYLRGITMLNVAGHLPGVFESNPFPGAINGSLWTLPFEALCYVLVAVLGVLGLLRVWIVLVIFCVLYIIFGLNLRSGEARIDSAVEFGLFFAAGMVCYVYRQKLRFSSMIAASCVSISFVAILLGGWRWVLPVAGPYIIFYFAYASWLPLNNWAKHGDFSYGLYVFAFPIQQIVAASKIVSPLLNILISLPITLALAWASWHLIEKPCLQLKGKSAPRRKKAPNSWAVWNRSIKH